MSILGPTTDVDRTVWQVQATRVLSDVLTRALRQKLPPLHWSVATSGLAAQCLQHDMSARRAAFATWADFLGIEDRHEVKNENTGMIHLTGSRKGEYKVGRYSYRCHILLSASLNGEDGQ